jgi:spermidine/putrescine transport system permease protein
MWLVLGALIVAPLLIILLSSFLDPRYRGFTPFQPQWEFIRSGKFVETYSRTISLTFLKIFWRSTWVAALTTVLCILVSFPMAYYVAIVAPARRRGLLIALVVIPFWTSFVIRTGAWKFILGTQGLLNVLLGKMGIAPFNLLYTDVAVMIGLVYGELPFMILPLYASLEKLDRTLLEAAGDLGAGTVSTFFRVTVPLAMPGLLAGTILVFIPSLGQYVVSDLLGGGKFDLLGNVIQRQFTTARDRPFGAAVAVELVVLVMAMLAAYGIYARRKGAEVAL